MTALRMIFTLGLVLYPGICFSEIKSAPAKTTAKADRGANQKDQILVMLTRYFSQADGIHKEAWWVLTASKQPAGKSPFGKVERALMSSEGIQLTNKSLFRCDRYLLKAQRGKLSTSPQKFQIFEKCSDKMAERKLADLSMSRADSKEVQVVFYPENLEEVLGLGPSVLAKPMDCTLKGNDNNVLLSLRCQNWSQDRSKEQMIRLDTYEYNKDGKILIKLRGKVYENLSDIRKIEADVPARGKIQVTETELHAPPEDKSAAKSETKAAPKAGVKSERGSAPSTPVAETGSADSGVTNPSPRPRVHQVDPDIIQGRFKAAPHNEDPSLNQAPSAEQIQPLPEQPMVNPQPLQQPMLQEVPVGEPSGDPADQGWPVDQQGQPMVPTPNTNPSAIPTPESGTELPAQPAGQPEMQQEVSPQVQPQGVPSGR